MFRWYEVQDQTIFDMTVKMYRNPFVALSSVASPDKGLEFDHHAFKHMESELFMYRILDTNFENYIEERGDIDRVSPVYIPTRQDIGDTIL